ncbi:CoA-binding protein [bacterium]|nr:CoA-binding protein [bacterium]
MIEELLSRRRFAVVGVSTNTEKYGWIVFENLRSRGYEAYAVNPRHTEVHGHPCVASLADLPEPPEVVVTVVPPAVTRETVRQALALGVRYFWMQPGSEDDGAIAAAEAAGARVVHHQCIMLH